MESAWDEFSDSCAEDDAGPSIGAPEATCAGIGRNQWAVAVEPPSELNMEESSSGSEADDSSGSDLKTIYSLHV